MTKAEELAELMFRERQEKQIRYARERYQYFASMLSKNAIAIGFSRKEDAPIINRFLDTLEKLFGKETFKQIDR